VSPVIAWSPGRASLQLALLLLGLAAVALTGLEIALFVTGNVEPVWAVAVYALVGLLYVGAGLLAWWRRPRGRIGALLAACGFSVLVASLGNTSVVPLTVAGAVTAELPIGVLLHLLLAFPTGRLPDRRSRVLVGAGYLVTMGLQTPQYLFGDPASVPGVLIVANRPDVVELLMTVQRYAGFVVIVSAALTMISRWRGAVRPGRRVLAAVSAYGTFTILFLTVSAIIARATGLDPLVLFEAQMLVVAGVPFAFVAGVLRGGFARTATVDELADWLGTAEGARPALRDAIAATLGDPSVELLFWLGDQRRYVDAAGDAVAPPGRASAEVDVRGERVGAIVYDAGLVDDPSIAYAAGRVVALAVERERLTAQLLAGRAALRESRARIVAAGDQERRRIARDLHDGLQAHLVLLALHAGRMAAGPDHAVAEQATQVRTAAELAIAELRRLVHGILPALLQQRGLYAAVEELVDRMPIPTRLDRPDGDPTLPGAVESAGYFTVAEGLANAVKHAGARELRVRLAHVGGRLEIEVRDDGIGGASIAAGGGLRGIVDRVEALGGCCRVDSAPGAGTCLWAELPCEL